MKKSIAFLAALCLLLPLGGCTGEEPPAEEAAAPIPAAAEAVPAEPAPTPDAPVTEPEEAETEDNRILYCRSFCIRREDSSFTLLYNAINDRWSLTGSDGDWIDAETLPEESGRLTLRHGEDTWRFLPEEDELIFDGGSPLFFCGTGGADGTPAPLELSPGTRIPLEDTACLYSNVPYEMDFDSVNWKARPGPHESSPPKIQLDIEQGRYILWDQFGDKEEGRVEFIRDKVKLGQGTDACFVFPEGEHLSVPSHVFYTAMYLSVNEKTRFYPLLDADAAGEEGAFSVEYAPEALPRENFLLTYEEFMVYSKYSEALPEGFLLLECRITLYPRENLCLLGSELPVPGTYTESDGELVLTVEDREYVFLRQGDAIRQVDGAPLFLQGSYQQGAHHIREDLPMDSVFPLYSRGGLRSGTYRLESEGCAASITLDLETMSCTFLPGDGREYSGPLQPSGTQYAFEGPAGTAFFSADGVDGLRLSNTQRGSRLLPAMETETLHFVFGE